MTGNTRLWIHKANPGDAGALAGLFDAYREFYRQRSDKMAAKRFLQNRLRRKESVVFFARIGKDAVGFVQLYPTFTSVALKRLWILNDLYVVPKGRRLGVAAALMARACKLALETRAEGLCLETAVKNIAAQRLYKKLGWKREKGFYRYNYDL